MHDGEWAACSTEAVESQKADAADLKAVPNRNAFCLQKYYKGRELAAPAVPEKTDSGEFAIDRVTIEGPA